MQYSFWSKKYIIGFYLSVLVLLIHISTFANYELFNTGFTKIFIVFLKSTFSEVGVPLFFILSGITYFRNYNDKINYFQKLKGKIKSIFIPYLLWNILHMMFSIITSYTFVANYFIGREKFIINFKNIVGSILLFKCNPVFWFIFDLIIFFIISPLFDCLSKTKLISSLSFIGLIILISFTDLLNFKIMFRSDAIVFFFLGCYLGKYHFQDITKLRYSKCLSMLGGLYILIYSCWMCYIIINNTKVDKIFYELSLIVLCVAFWFFSDIFLKCKLPEFLLSNSFFIYAMHVDVAAIITKLFWIVFPKNLLFAYLNFFFTLIITILSICIFAKLLKQNKYSKRIYYLLSGNR